MSKEQLGQIKSILMSGVFQFLEFDKRAAPGCCIIYLFPNSVPPEMNDVAQMMACTWFVLTRAAAAHVDNMRQVCVCVFFINYDSYFWQGYIMVEDFKDVTLGHLLHLAGDSKKNKKQFDAIQDHLPGRFRLFLLANSPWWIRVPFKLMSVFMKVTLWLGKKKARFKNLNYLFKGQIERKVCSR